MNVQMVNVANVKPASWSASHILTPDLRLLVKSIQEYGWLQPILVRSEDSTIIDGFSRWQIASSDKTVISRDKGMIPVHWINCSEVTAKIMHIRLNRARGGLIAQRLSLLVQDLESTSGIPEELLISKLGMTSDEFYVLMDSSLIKAKKLSEHTYSRAWVPVEVDPNATSDFTEMTFERPPTSDH